MWYVFPKLSIQTPLLSLHFKPVRFFSTDTFSTTNPPTAKQPLPWKIKPCKDRILEHLQSAAVVMGVILPVTYLLLLSPAVVLVSINRVFRTAYYVRMSLVWSH